MRTFILLLFTFHIAMGGKMFRLGKSLGGGVGIPFGANDISLPPAQWFKQRLDHNNPSDVRTWKQRYFVNDSYFDAANPGPVFLMIGGEGPADARWMVKGAWIEYAKEFRALCFQLEHRFYGESQPTRNTSVKNLQYLASLQALEDLAYFIASMKRKYNLSNTTQWVVFGGSYPGSLAAWSRMKYPHLINAAVSSSGPLLAKANFQEYFEAVTDSLREKTGNNDCIRTIEIAHNQIESYMKNNPRIVEEAFRVCKPFSQATSKDIDNFYSALADNFADLVQYNEDNRFTGDIHYKNITINSVCNILTKKGAATALKSLAQFNSIMLDKSKEKCLDYSYDKMIKDLSNTTWSLNAGRQWMWQTCTEFGFYQTSSHVVKMFGNNFPLEFFTQQCQDVFGIKYDSQFINDAVAWTNNKYGALDITADNIVYVHGSIDPWHRLGMIESKNERSPAIYIKGTAHCANMYPSSPDDSEQLVDARNKIKKHLAAWLNFA